MTAYTSVPTKRAVYFGSKHGLEFRDVLWSHERVMFPGHIDVPVGMRAKLLQHSKLVSQPPLVVPRTG